MPQSKPTVYVETTVFSALVARPTKNPLGASRQAASRVWWHHDADRFSLFASDVVTFEARQGDPEMARLRLEFIESLPILSSTKVAEWIADTLLDSGILPMRARTDALHLGVAAVHSLQFVASWNLKHLVNGPISARISRKLLEMGYNPPVICTPSQLPGVRHV